MVEWHSTPTILLPGFAPRIRGMFVDACFSPGFPVFIPPQNKRF